MIQRHSVLLLVGIAGSIAVAACGGAGEAKAPAKMSKPESSAREPSSIEEAQEQIQRASAELAGGDGKKAEGDKLDKDRAAPAQTPGGAAGSTSTSDRPATPREESSRGAPADSCSQSCRALSSMRRAVSALCRMTGDEDARCSDARKTLEQSESRVARCHCGT